MKNERTLVQKFTVSLAPHGISLSHTGVVCFRVKRSHCLTCGMFQGGGMSLSHCGLACFRVKGSCCLTLVYFSGGCNLAISHWCGMFEGEGISLSHLMWHVSG